MAAQAIKTHTVFIPRLRNDDRINLRLRRVIPNAIQMMGRIRGAMIMLAVMRGILF